MPTTEAFRATANIRLFILNQKLEGNADPKYLKFNTEVRNLMNRATEKFDRQMKEIENFRIKEPYHYEIKAKSIAADYQTFLDMLIADINNFKPDANTIAINKNKDR